MRRALALLALLFLVMIVVWSGARVARSVCRAQCLLELRPSRYGGQGVFATRPLRKGEVIEKCPYLKVKPDTHGIRDYVFEHSDGKHHMLVLGYGGMYNHSKQPNATYEENGDTMVYYATRDIPKNAEITISYGSGWWDTRTKSMIT